MEKFCDVNKLPLWHRGGRGAASLFVAGVAATLTETLFDLMVEKIKNRRTKEK